MADDHNLHRTHTHESPLAHSDYESSSDIESGSASHAEKSEDNDGHRPSLREQRSLTSIATRRSLASASGANLEPTTSRHESIIARIRSRPIPQFTHPLAHVKTTEDELVDFDGPDDPYRPINWPTHKKVSTTLLYGLVTMTATWASSSYSAGTREIAHHFDVSTQVATLGTTLFLFGFGLGPLLWAPLSEVYGRRLAVLVPMFIATCFSFGSAAAKDFQTLMLTRFWGAFFASAPVTNTGGVLGDLYSATWRGIAMAGYAMAVVGGPVLGELFFLSWLNGTNEFRSHCIRSRCPGTTLGMAMDRILDGYPTGVRSRLRRCVHRRDLSSKAPRL